LVEPFYAFCTEPTPTDPNNNTWCTVAPSDGIYYNSTGIPEWTNSLLVVTLKDGLNEDMELYQFKLNSNGSLATSTPSNPNPKKFFGNDQQLNGRLRDLAVSPDGKKIFLINNGGGTSNTSKVSVYTYVEPTYPNGIHIAPNPGSELITITHSPLHGVISILNSQGKTVTSYTTEQHVEVLDFSNYAAGIYIVKFESNKEIYSEKLVITN
jgi:DNA-binding beta-propeller fold protein YncE